MLPSGHSASRPISWNHIGSGVTYALVGSGVPKSSRAQTRAVGKASAGVIGVWATGGPPEARPVPSSRLAATIRITPAMARSGRCRRPRQLDSPLPLQAEQLFWFPLSYLVPRPAHDEHQVLPSP